MMLNDRVLGLVILVYLNIIFILWKKCKFCFDYLMFLIYLLICFNIFGYGYLDLKNCGCN